MKTVIFEEYYKYLKEYKKEYKKVCVLIQIGSFYEMMAINENKEYLEEISKILDIQLTRRNKNTTDIADKHNPYMSGFPLVAINRYMKILIEKDYTVIVIDQYEKYGKIERKVKRICSKSLNMLSFEENTKENNILTSIFINEDEISIITLDNNINKIRIKESKATDMNTIHNILNINQSDEYNIYVKNNEKISSEIDKIKEVISINEIHEEQIIKSCIKSNNIQNQLLKEYYKHINFGLCDPIEYFNLERRQLSSLNLVYTLMFLKKHDEMFIENICKPEIEENVSNVLKLELNTIQQLNILPRFAKEKSVLNVVDFTITAIGKRYIKELLKNPYKNKEEICKKYNNTKEWINNKIDYKKIQNLLKDIYDIEKYQRKIGLKILSINEFIRLHKSYKTIIEILEILNKMDNKKDYLRKHIDKIEKIIEIYTEKICLETILETEEYLLNETTNFIKENKILKEYEKKIRDEEEKIKAIRENISSITNVDIKLIKERDQYYLSTTKMRLEGIKKDKKIDISTMIIKTLTNETRLCNEEMMTISNKINEYTEEFIKEKNVEYVKVLEILQENNLKDIIEFIGEIEIIICNLELYNKYKYTCPIITSTTESYIKCKQIRHPIIERILTDTLYIPNDIILSNESNIILYAFNSVGKSSLLRAIGINLILAQCGMYVSASEFEYGIFENIICQVDLTDNLHKSNSSFISELKGIKYILENSNEKTLILADEVNKGTESISASSIFASLANSLTKKKTKFLMTTHLHELPELTIIKNNKNIIIKHLSVEIEDNNIRFTRTLKDGKISPLYGIEIASTLLEKKFINTCYKIREELTINTKKIKPKTVCKSRYNSNKVIIKCEICEVEENLETHHIKFQRDADEKGYFEDVHYHKNTKANLCTLCRECHVKIEKRELNVYGYITTTNGVKLNYKEEYN
jgi:DNA mismatch repair protein MutS